MPVIGEPYHPQELQSFTAVDDRVMLIPHKTLGGIQKLVLARLQRFGARTGEIFPSIPTLCAAIGGVPDRIMYGILAELEEKKFIKRIRYKNAPSRWVLLWHEAFESTPPRPPELPNPELKNPAIEESRNCKKSISQLKDSAIASIRTEETREETSSVAKPATARVTAISQKENRPATQQTFGLEAPLPPTPSPKPRQRSVPPGTYTEADLTAFQVGVTEVAASDNRKDLGKCGRQFAIDALALAKGYPVDQLVRAISNEVARGSIRNMRTWGLLPTLIARIVSRKPEYEPPVEQEHKTGDTKPAATAVKSQATVDQQYADFATRFEAWVRSRGVDPAQLAKDSIAYMDAMEEFQSQPQKVA